MDSGRLARVEAFATLKPGAVVLEFEEVTITPDVAARMPGPSRPAVGQKTRLPLRVIAPFDADLVMVVTALDLADARPHARGRRGSALLAADDPSAVVRCPALAVSTATEMVFTDVARGERDGP